MITAGHILYIVVVVFTLCLLLWWRLGVENDPDAMIKTTFPQWGHVVIFFVGSFFPIYNCVQALILLAIYIAFRVDGDLKLKENKFNRFWFGVSKEK